MTDPAPAAVARSADARRKVLVFDIDGVRWDKLQEATTPNLDALAAIGRLGPTWTHDPRGGGVPTVSGPGHSSIVTGVWPDKHRVIDNAIEPNELARYPDFLTRLRALRPELTTFAVGDWPPLIDQIIDAPTVKLLQPYAEGDTVGASSTQVIAQWAIERLATDDADVGYVYFLQVDHAGHHFGGVSAEYLRAIADVDGAIGSIVDAVRARADYTAEDWLFVAVTDHGHLDEGGHGGPEPEVRRIWTLVTGGDVPRSPTGDGLRMVDVVPTVLQHLDVGIDPAWDLDGRPFAWSAAVES